MYPNWGKSLECQYIEHISEIADFRNSESKLLNEMLVYASTMYGDCIFETVIFLDEEKRNESLASYKDNIACRSYARRSLTFKRG